MLLSLFKKALAKPTDEDHVLTIPGLLTPSECEAWVRIAEGLGFDEAPVSTFGGPVRLPGVRNNTRVMIDNVPLAKRLWDRLVRELPQSVLDEEPTGLNERLRFYRYDPGERFKPHCDGYYERPDGSERSRLTFLIYLNEDCEGGETRLIAPVSQSIAPRTGSALIFPHGFLHEGCEVTAGRKYVLRSDVMFGT